MSELIVMTLEHEAEASQLRQTLKELERKGLISLDDAAIVEKDPDGTVHVKNELDTGIKLGALGGTLIGLITSFVFPVVGMVVGALGGALVGKSFDLGVDQDFVKDVSESLKPGGSALFLMVRHSNPDAVVSALQPHKGKIIQTTLPPEKEEALQQALDERK
ncbi:MAG TPA: DUF1269 domain-containing protein [Chloroflexia bacterium]|nr:DUF1269 domain-containing protein [Chloroflexia bacterium]